MKNSLWFMHDGNARNDIKIQVLIRKYNFKGYGLYWYFIEEIFESNELQKYPVSNINFIALLLDIEIDEIREIIGFIIELDLLQSDGEFIWCNSLDKRTLQMNNKRNEISESRSLAGKKGAKTRWNADGKKDDKDSDNEDPMAKDGKAWQSMAYKTREDKTREDQTRAYENTNMADSEESVVNDVDNNQVEHTKKTKTESQDILFEELWLMYPKKMNKNSIKKARKKEIEKIGKEKMIKAISNYKKFIAFNKTEMQYVMYGSTFFNGAYIDWIDSADNTIEPTTTIRGRKYINYDDELEDDVEVNMNERSE